MNTQVLKPKDTLQYSTRSNSTQKETYYHNPLKNLEQID